MNGFVHVCLRKPAALAAAVVLSVTGLAAFAAPAAEALGTAQPTVVNAVPAAYTPNINDGIVYSIGQTGSTVVMGGTFDSVSPAGSASTSIPVSDVVAYTAGTGAIVTSFQPTLDGAVNAVIAGPVPGTIYIGGAFKTVDGVTSRVALLDATTGQMVPGWTSPKINGDVNSLALANGQLFVGGFFGNVAGSSRGGLATLNATTGALTSYSTLAFSGHHNFGVHCTGTNCANAGVGIRSIDVTPDGTTMVVTGNFTSVSGFARDQVAMLTLTGTSASVDQNWATDGFTSACASNAFDAYIRQVQFAPDGSYFVIVDTGAGGTGARNSDGTRAICDAAARFETGATGADVQPTWVDWTGNDSFWSVAVTGTAIYVGGHQRWLNNSAGSDRAGEGAVPRPGLAAIDPQNGMPLAWNPGRNPRGAGAFAVFATPDGLYVGSDTDWVGNFQYHHEKNAFFPLAGGETLPSNTVGSLPGNVYLFDTSANSSGVQTETWDGVSAPTTGPGVSGFNNSTVRGAFAVNGSLYYGTSSGGFFQAPFQGRSVGASVAIDPYDDPAWSNVDTGSGQTYRGVKSTFYSELPSMTSMFYSNGRVYYTLSTKRQMFWRYFETDDGVVGADEFATIDTNDWSRVAGAFLSGNTLYFANSFNGNLMQIPFINGQPSGTPTVADTSINWASRGDVLLGASQIPPNQPPTSSFTISCTTTANPCSADASASSDSDGFISGYGWDWGDGTTSQTSTPTTTHTYSAAGNYTVTLTVTDNSSATGVSTQPTHVVDSNAPPITFRATAGFDANSANPTVTVPSAVQPGDEMLLFSTYASTTVTATPPAGWTLIGSTSHSNLTTAVYSRSATVADPGTAVTVALSGTVKASLTLTAYANAKDPVEVSSSAVDASTANHTSRTVTGLATGSFAVTMWADKASTTTAWTTPPSVTVESTLLGSAGGAVSAVVADSGSAVTGSYGGLTATTNVTSGSGASWTIGLAING